MRIIKIIFYLILTAATGYFAGLYRSEGLMIFCVAELLFLLMLLIEVFLASRGLEAEPDPDRHGSLARLTCGDRAQMIFRITNRSPLMLLPYQLTFRMQQPGVADRTAVVTGTCRRRTSKSLSLTAEAPHCGLVRTEVRKARVTDPIGFFALPASSRGTAEIAVMPKFYTILLPEDVLRSSRRPDPGPIPDPTSDDTPDEVRDIREYREGDSFRRIHWNMTARTDELWVREYQSDVAHQSITICADRAGLELAGPSRDLWYTALAALIRTCFAEGNPVYLYPPPGENTPGARRRMRTEEDITALLLDLYREADESRIPATPEVPLDEAEYRLDPSLNLYQGGELLYPGSSVAKGGMFAV